MKPARKKSGSFFPEVGTPLGTLEKTQAREAKKWHLRVAQVDTALPATATKSEEKGLSKDI